MKEHKNFLVKLANIMKEHPQTRFYRAPYKLYEICEREGQQRSLVDCLIHNRQYYPVTCSKNLKLNGEVVAEYCSNTGELSQLYLRNYKMKKLISYEIEKGAVQISRLIKETEEIENWEIKQADLLKEPVSDQRDTTILQDPFTYDNYYNLTEDEYVEACSFMVRNALAQTTTGGRFIVLDHGPDIFDYATLSRCKLGKNTENVILNTDLKKVSIPF